MENFTVCFETWASKIYPAFKPNGPEWIDIAGLKYMEPYIDSYMTAPTSIFNGKGIAAKTMRVEKLEDFTKMLKDTNQKMVMYMLIWEPSRPIYCSINENSDLIPLAYPDVSPGFWKVRGHWE